MKNTTIIFLLVIGIGYGFKYNSYSCNQLLLRDYLKDTSIWRKNNNGYYDSLFSRSNCTYLKNTSFENVFVGRFTVMLNKMQVRLSVKKLQLKNDSVCGKFFNNLRLTLFHDTIRRGSYADYCLDSKMITWSINIRHENFVYLIRIQDKEDYFNKVRLTLEEAQKEFGIENVFYLR